MARALPIVLGLGAAGALLLLLGGKAKAAPAPTPVPPTPPPSPTPVPGPTGPVNWRTLTTTGQLASWLADKIASLGWRAFSPIDPTTEAFSPEQIDNGAALREFQSRLGLTPDGILGPRTGGGLIFFEPSLESVLDAMGVFNAIYPGGTPYTAAQITAAVNDGQARAQSVATAETPTT